MSRGNALGFIESVGLASAIAAADAALKAANVELIGRENSKGFGYITIKLVGEVGAVQAAISAAKASSSKVARVWSTDIIPRPSKDLGKVLVWNKDTQGADDWFMARDLEKVPTPSAERENKQLANRPKAELVPVPEEEKPKPAPEATENEPTPEETPAPKAELVPVPEEEKPKPAPEATGNEPTPKASENEPTPEETPAPKAEQPKPSVQNPKAPTAPKSPGRRKKTK